MRLRLTKNTGRCIYEVWDNKEKGMTACDDAGCVVVLSRNKAMGYLCNEHLACVLAVEKNCECLMVKDGKFVDVLKSRFLAEATEHFETIREKDETR